MTKTQKKRIICIFAFALFFVLLYGIGYYFGYSVFENNIIKKETINQNNPVISEVMKTDKLYVNNSMKYYVEKINIKTGEKNTVSENIPVKLVGMTRDELSLYIENDKDSFAEGNEVVQSIMLLTFNESRIVLREYYDIIEETTTVEIVNYKFVIKLENNEIAVYKLDDNTVFLKTKVKIETLDSDSINRKKNGIKVRNISELYRMLESFTT